MKKLPRFLTTLIAAAVLSSSLGCSQISREEIIDRAAGAAINAGVALIVPITPEQEKAIGEQVKQQMLQEYKLYTASPSLVTYVRGVGQKLAAKAKRRGEVNYEFYVVDSSEVNAFAIPGGGVFVTTEALKYMHNEAELAGVLGHEIAHVDEKHGVEAIKRAMVLQGVAEGALSQNDPALVKILASLVLDLTQKGFSREQEREADRVGVVFSTQQSYDPKGLNGFLNTLLQLSGGDPQWPLNFLLTHPGSQERITALNNQITQQNLKPANPVVNETIFKQQVAVLPPKVSTKR